MKYTSSHVRLGNPTCYRAGAYDVQKVFIFLTLPPKGTIAVAEYVLKPIWPDLYEFMSTNRQNSIFFEMRITIKWLNDATAIYKRT